MQDSGATGEQQEICYLHSCLEEWISVSVQSCRLQCPPSCWRNFWTSSWTSCLRFYYKLILNFFFPSFNIERKCTLWNNKKNNFSLQVILSPLSPSSCFHSGPYFPDQDQTQAPAVEAGSPNHWIARKAPHFLFKYLEFPFFAITCFFNAFCIPLSQESYLLFLRDSRSSLFVFLI